MLKIRLQRTGRKHEPTFRVVLTDSKNGPKSGRFIEILGNYDPRRNEDIQLKKERIQHWIAQGAKPSDTLHNILIDQGIIKGEKINVLPKKTPPVKEEEKVEEAPKVETKLEETPAETPNEEIKEVVEESPVETKQEEIPAEEIKEETASTEEAK
jgi:small subunit ribosomal protein S16